MMREVITSSNAATTAIAYRGQGCMYFSKSAYHGDKHEWRGPYASGAGRVILVVGTQKIVTDLDEGLRRINDYSFPMEDARAQEAYGIHSAVNKVLIVNREIVPDRFTVVLVDEALGF